MENLIVVFSKLQSNFGVFCLFIKIILFLNVFLMIFFNVKLVLIYFICCKYTKTIHISGEIFNRFYRFLFGLILARIKFGAIGAKWQNCVKLNPRQINLFFDCVKLNAKFFWLILNYGTTQKIKVL